MWDCWCPVKWTSLSVRCCSDDLWLLWLRGYLTHTCEARVESLEELQHPDTIKWIRVSKKKKKTHRPLLYIGVCLFHPPESCCTIWDLLPSLTIYSLLLSSQRGNSESLIELNTCFCSVWEAEVFGKTQTDTRRTCCWDGNNHSSDSVANDFIMLSIHFCDIISNIRYILPDITYLMSYQQNIFKYNHTVHGKLKYFYF